MKQQTEDALDAFITHTKEREAQAARRESQAAEAAQRRGARIEELRESVIGPILQECADRLSASGTQGCVWDTTDSNNRPTRGLRLVLPDRCLSPRDAAHITFLMDRETDAIQVTARVVRADSSSSGQYGSLDLLTVSKDQVEELVQKWLLDMTS